MNGLSEISQAMPCFSCRHPNACIYDATTERVFCTACGNGMNMAETPPLAFKTPLVAAKEVRGTITKDTKPADIVVDFFESDPLRHDDRILSSLTLCPKESTQESVDDNYNDQSSAARFAAVYYRDLFAARRRYNTSRADDSTVGTSDGVDGTKSPPVKRRYSKRSSETERLSNGSTNHDAGVGRTQHAIN